MISHRQAVAMGSCDGRGLNAFDDQIDTQRELPHSDRKGNAAGSWAPEIEPRGGDGNDQPWRGLATC
jgi:hypothetical protein